MKKFQIFWLDQGSEEKILMKNLFCVLFLNDLVPVFALSKFINVKYSEFYLDYQLIIPSQLNRRPLYHFNPNPP